MTEDADRTEMPGWDVLDTLELSVSSHVRSQLEPILPLFQTLYDAAVSVPVFSDSEKVNTDPDFSSLFMKRALTDWRTIWLLLVSGYSSQAGTVAASLWENALAAIAFISEPPKSGKWNTSTDQGKLPWSAKSLAEITSRHLQKRARERGDEYSDLQVESTWRILYGVYGWLCDLKHPTIRAAYYDYLNTQVSENNYILMTVPDSRNEDLRTKYSVVCLAGLPFLHAVRCYGESRAPSKANERYKRFVSSVDGAEKMLHDLTNTMPEGSVPVDNRGSRVAKEWAKIMQGRDSEDSA